MARLSICNPTPDLPEYLPRPPLPCADALDVIDRYHAGESRFNYVLVRLGELGCSPAVIQAFIAEAFERAR